MRHVPPELMQRFLAGEVDLMERDAVSDHLTCCEACTDLLVQLTAEDDALTAALRLETADEAWIAGLDLTGPVMERLDPWYRRPAIYLPALLATVCATGMLQVVLSFLTDSFASDPVGLVVGLFRNLLPALWHLNVYLSRGGLLTTLMPVTLLAGVIWGWRARSKKEVAFHA
ncbi:MAG TPA: hypothetical protein VK464_28030 [Symbiobacteriaceae bacterium]|nr:hypothetical protein [Symbiobacteriaceae bacterium]